MGRTDNLKSYYDINLKKARLNRLLELPNFRFEKADLADREETARFLIFADRAM